ncbi:ABC transporter substrate-binding protein [Rhodoferax sp.]|jgi:putative thiamine transport system substrate-binding protein|uniref:ABC transporter substrate-binding protein n=1 Tax=Rhodoferax sp. TaxID=50421 RepID=UPI002731DD6B|nr:ABC transporter substrate-binding protein [Rhodoferax sp.]MDP1527908.1 ABC transporter substrate-binding protein [Rhodoferax sp.]MDP1944479.1 ABC transporter substrate-binding protein [Rhodoferax sp.]MDP2440127.1 ABC transporter substrate-binding protein [Rhodoferax sp.]MDP3190689.1 ABC transporter substrate-binding protein [Rhodoferax sp.]MDP3335536.1 ABC transporter substrate-binding protein [Rhodoferax sp.]
MKFLTFAATALSLGVATLVHADWSQIQNEAKGQTVYFNAWGGSEATNAYISWAAKEAKTRYGLDVRHVKITDAAEVVKRLQTEVAAGRTSKGSVDLMWVNGENFRNLKNGGLLFGPWAQSLPNWGLVDLNKPVQTDFSVPTEGYESPWGTAQLTFIADRVKTPTPPRSAQELLSFAKANPGRVSYPKPPDFHGTTFVKQLLLELTPNKAALQQAVTPAAFASVTQALWVYLDQLHPALWRNGKSFPSSAAEMHRMLGDGELKMSLTFNPNEAANLIVTKQLSPSTYSFGFTGGTIGNVHFVAIPGNATAKAGAQVFANFLLSSEAQIRKANINVWGDGTVLDVNKLPAAAQAQIRKTAPGALAESVPTLPEPHASWVEALEAEWLMRYGTR